VLGFLVSAFELPCTGAFYLAVLSLLAKNETMARGFIYLVVYNLIFVLPLVIILVLVYYGYSSSKLNQLREAKRKWLKLLMGIGMLILGILMVWGKI
jgi:cytochrome c biogenesis protein CcdA